MSDREYQVLSSDVFKLVSSSDCPAYDCEFVALAEHLDTKLVTMDGKLLWVFRKLLWR